MTGECWRKDWWIPTWWWVCHKASEEEDRNTQFCFSTGPGQAQTFPGTSGSQAKGSIQPEYYILLYHSSSSWGIIQWAIKIYNPNGLNILSLGSQVQIRSDQAFRLPTITFSLLSECISTLRTSPLTDHFQGHLWMQSPKQNLIYKMKRKTGEFQILEKDGKGETQTSFYRFFVS